MLCQSNWYKGTIKEIVLQNCTIASNQNTNVEEAMCPKLTNQWNQCPDFHLCGLSENHFPVRAVIHCFNTTVKVLYNLHRDRELFICKKDYFGEHGENLDQQTAYQQSDFLPQKPWVWWKKVLCFMKLTTMTKFFLKNKFILFSYNRSSWHIFCHNIFLTKMLDYVQHFVIKHTKSVSETNPYISSCGGTVADFHWCLQIQ